MSTLVGQTRWAVSVATVFQLFAEFASVLAAVLLSLQLRGGSLAAIGTTIAPAIVFALVMVFLQGLFGLYRRDRKLPLGTYAGRLILCLVIGVPIVYYVAGLLPGGGQFRDSVQDSIVFAFAGLVLVRKLVIGPVLTLAMPHRVLVLGTGQEARMVEASLKSADGPGLELVGFYALEKVPEVVVSPARIVARDEDLDRVVQRLGIDEIIVAVRQQRGGVLPLKSLLDCRLSGVRITDLARFFERVHGQIPIEALKASWLIYGNGFRQDWLRTTIKRAFDLAVATVLLLLMLPVIVITALAIAMESGGPIIYRQERVGLRGKSFFILKFRSMGQDAEKDGQARWASANDSRITNVGRIIRRTRIDELPQLINVLRGEMSFVGPRPERPVFVQMLTAQIPFYAIRQSVKPGLTGWAQVRYSYGADVEQSLKKLEYDLYYVKNHTLFLDILILVETVRVVLLGEGAR